MSTILKPPQLTRADWLAWGTVAVALVFVLKTHLLPALLAGLLVFSLVQLLTPRLKISSLDGRGRRLLAVAMVAGAVIAGMSGLGFALASFFRGSDESVPALFQRMAEIIDQSRERFPDWLLANLPDNAEDLRRTVTEWLRVHAQSVQTASTDFLRGLAHVIIGMVIGAMLALQSAAAPREVAPLTAAVSRHGGRVAGAFRRVVFAQVWISGINTLLTWLYLGTVLPLLDIHLPLTKTLVALTFVAGLLPIIGNLISNTAIFVVSMSQSLVLAFASLAYLFVIHKLEYFLNARIIGGHIRARAWELLLAMLVMEASFGLSGLIVAPMAYAYFKDELREKGLI
ncbi:MAG: AI-2E family transporter [Stagnimonas sp.]|nr:AI-2E family transporter [Stagnimonas sp.]